jgi:RNA polymerase sigma factor (TIGR02999 family)
MDQPDDLTGLLQAWSRGDSDALDELAPLVHRELRLIARRLLAAEPRPVAWQPTELVHECFLRLLDWRAFPWQNRAHFYGTTARMMRRVLVDAARARHTAKRDGGTYPPIDPDDVAAPAPPVDLLALDRGLESLEAISPRSSRVVELRYFGGFTVEETAEALGVSVRTVINDWNTARAWLHHQLRTPQDRSA